MVLLSSELGIEIIKLRYKLQFIKQTHNLFYIVQTKVYSKLLHLSANNLFLRF